MLLISPLAYLFGKEYQREGKEEEKKEIVKEKVEEYVDEIEDNTQSVLEKEKGILKPDEVNQLNSIQQDAEKIREEVS